MSALLLLVGLLCVLNVLALKASPPKRQQQSCARNRESRHVHGRLVERAAKLATTTTAALFNRPWASSAAPVPVDISSGDKAIDAYSQAPAQQLIMPDVAITALDGADNLGTLLWAFVVYNGLFPVAGRPANWVLPVIAKALGEEDKDWFKDFQDGYHFECPPVCEAFRVILFGFVGYIFNAAWISVLDGDSFWGWSTAACLSIPSGLITISRGKRTTREEAMKQDQLRDDFAEFSRSTLRGGKDRKCREERIMYLFRRSKACYRDPEGDFSDKMLQKVIRSTIGYKPDVEGIFKGVGIGEKKVVNGQTIVVMPGSSTAAASQASSSSSSSRETPKPNNADKVSAIDVNEEFAEVDPYKGQRQGEKSESMQDFSR